MKFTFNCRLERSAVSGKTQYLVAGFEMEDGRPITEGSKYKKAVEKKVRIINEDDLLNMIRESNPDASATAEEVQRVEMARRQDIALTREEEVMKDHTPTNSSRMFTIRYAPSNLHEIIGNEKVISNLRLWLSEWEDVHIHRSILTI